MWWHCAYKAHPRVNAADLAKRFLKQHDAGSNHPECIRGWYMFGTGTSGFVLIEAGTSKDLAKVLAPYSELVQWQVETTTEILYPMFLEETRQRYLTKHTDSDTNEGLTGGMAH